ncbi:hypothetical protein BWD121_001530 [Bartonella sp. WD12.1]|nr:hypothetical protein BWD121_001530 [Bartonella sp. WD12.1]
MKFYLRIFSLALLLKACGIEVKTAFTDNKQTFHVFLRRIQNFRITDVVGYIFKQIIRFYLLYQLNDKNVDFDVRARIYECAIAFKVESVSL